MSTKISKRQTILNVAGLAQQCNYETKGLQLLLYFEKNNNVRTRIAIDASVMMYDGAKSYYVFQVNSFRI